MLLSATVSFSALAQTGASRQVNDRAKNEISASYGIVTIMQIGSIFAGASGVIVSGGNVIWSEMHCSGAISISYYRALNKWLSVGMDLAGEYVSLVYESKSSGNRTNSNTMIFSPMLTAKGNWLRRNHFDIYSRISTGAMLFKNPSAGDFKTAFAVQVSPIGLEFGGISFRGFVEGGIGTQGILVAGLKYRF